MLFGSTTDGTLIDANVTDIANAVADRAKHVFFPFFCRRTNTRDQVKHGINLMKEIHVGTFQIRLLPTRCSSFNFFPSFLHDQQFGTHIFLISSLISDTGAKKKITV